MRSFLGLTSAMAVLVLVAVLVRWSDSGDQPSVDAVTVGAGDLTAERPTRSDPVDDTYENLLDEYRKLAAEFRAEAAAMEESGKSELASAIRAEAAGIERELLKPDAYMDRPTPEEASEYLERLRAEIAAEKPSQIEPGFRECEVFPAKVTDIDFVKESTCVALVEAGVAVYAFLHPDGTTMAMEIGPGMNGPGNVKTGRWIDSNVTAPIGFRLDKARPGLVWSDFEDGSIIEISIANLLDGTPGRLAA